MKLELTASADRGRTLMLSELARIIEDATRIGVSQYSTPTVVTDATRLGGRGEIRKITFQKTVL